MKISILRKKIILRLKKTNMEMDMESVTVSF